MPVLIERIDVSDSAITITPSVTGMCALLKMDIDPQLLPPISAPISRIRKGKEVKLILSDATTTERDEGLVSILREAMAVRQEILATSDMTIAEIAASGGRCRKRLSRLFHLSWIAPEIVDAILAGRQPTSLTPKALLAIRLPIDWSDQASALGFT